MLVEVNGALGAGVSAKDVILAIIGKIGTAGGTGHVIEYAGSTIRGLSMEGRMTLCNMTIEGGARAGLVAPDETTFAYLKGRPHAPKGAAWEQAVAYWRTLPSDPGALFDREEGLDRIFLEAGFQWREPGCSMCMSMNADKATAGERVASTSNRNFEGRQGKGARTHLVSPAMAAAAAVTGRLTDVRELG